MNKYSFLPTLLVGASVAVVTNVAPAAAFTLGSYLVPTNSQNNPNVSSQIQVNVGQISGTNDVRFTFRNTGPIASSINDIYFGQQSESWANLFSVGYIVDRDGSYNGQFGHAGVDFSSGAAPQQNPQGAFGWSSRLSAGADGQAGGATAWGINPNEYLDVVFRLNNQSTFNQVQSGFESGVLAIAFHVQSIGTQSGSDWYSTSRLVTAEDVPEPFTILGTGAALGFNALFQRERNKRKNKAKA